MERVDRSGGGVMLLLPATRRGGQGGAAALRKGKAGMRIHQEDAMQARAPRDSSRAEERLERPRERVGRMLDVPEADPGLARRSAAWICVVYPATLFLILLLWPGTYG